MRKDYDDDWSFEPPPKSLYVWREFSRKERKKREQEFFAKDAQKKKLKKLALSATLSVKFLSKKERKKRCFFSTVKLSLFILFLRPQNTHTSYDATKQVHTRRMTDSKRSNAAGEKYALRGIYGSEPYWPQEKLKICVTGAGGFIGET